MEVIDPTPVISCDSLSILVEVVSAPLVAVELGVVVVSDAGRIAPPLCSSHAVVSRVSAVKTTWIRNSREVFTSLSHQIEGVSPNYRVWRCSLRGRGKAGSGHSVSFGSVVSS